MIMAACHLSGQVTPSIVGNTNLTVAPYAYNGLLVTTDIYGSASVVSEGVIATAAHAVYNPVSSQWVAAGDLSYYPQHDTALDTGPSGTAYTPVASLRWTSYSDRNSDNQSLPGGLVIQGKFNLDFAVAYFSESLEAPELARHAEVNVDPEGETGLIRDSRDKMIVGYPSEFGHPGRLQEIVANDYFYWWEGVEGFAEVDRDNFGISLYGTDDATSSGGGSGGPVYVRDDLGNWLTAGILVGGGEGQGMLVYGISDRAWRLIEEAVEARSTTGLRRVDDLTVAGSGQSSVSLSWTDRSEGESGYRILRQATGTWEEIDIVAADASSYTDTAGVNPGSVYHYQVQPFAGNGNQPPKSPAVKAVTKGSHSLAAQHLGHPLLHFSGSGDSTWYVDESERLRAGKIRANGESTLALDIMGPGTLDFGLTVSCEVNLDYNNPNSYEEGLIYDAMYVYLNGEAVLLAGQATFLSGNFGPVPTSLQLPPGPHRIEWTYDNDSYASEHEDTGFLTSLAWTPDAIDPYPVYGGYAFPGTDWHGSEWLGVYNAGFLPWAGHTALGWLYFYTGTPDGQLYGYSPLEVLGNFYTTAGMFPYIYQLDTGDWLYYFKGTGNFGSGAWFWNISRNSYIQTP
jgi:hypothetical protein